MTLSAVLLLVGLFVVPVVLLWLGHGLRYRDAREKGAFWGGVIGYGAALGAFLVLTLVPPVGWAGSPARGLAVEAVLIVVPLLGAAVGAFRGSRKSARPDLDTPGQQP